MKRMKMFFRFDKEEKWLEEMTGNGWLLCGKGLFYDFQRCTPDRRSEERRVGKEC